jgi:1,4-dihydroxy-2-naphthoate octaprenyltransferase
MGLSLLTAILLQILSNLANDYGDAVSGADNGERIGPQRAVVSGLITRHQMCVAMGLTALAAVVSGLSLLVCAFGVAADPDVHPAGGAAIVAAITYTVGKSPYGYRGFGDISVFLFFGLLGCSAPTTSSPRAWSGTCCCPPPPAACWRLPCSTSTTCGTSRPMPPAARSPWRCALAQPGHRLSLGLAGGGAAGDHRLPADPACEPLALDLPARHEALTDAACTLRESFDGEVLTGALKKTAISAFLFSLLLSAGLALT